MGLGSITRARFERREPQQIVAWRRREFRMREGLILLGVILGLSSPVFAQQADAAPQVDTTPTDATQPAAPADAQPIFARVIEVSGDVRYAPVDSTDWKPVELDMQLPEQTQIRTGLRSGVKFEVGSEAPFTALVIESVGKVLLSEAYRSSETKRVRIGVAYGKVRAGVAEGGLQSDFTVDTPVATLSKRGTWDFGVRYERPDRFEFFLHEYGLIDVLNRLTGDVRTLQPGQRVTEAMRRWMVEARFGRTIPVSSILGQSNIELSFNQIRTNGLGITNLGGGQNIFVNLTNRSARRDFAGLVTNSLQNSSIPFVLNPRRGSLTAGPLRRPEGFFGTGRGDQLIPVVIDSASSLAQRGYAQPGTYRIRRAALESWLQKQR
jgi:hypothetical protein